MNLFSLMRSMAVLAAFPIGATVLCAVAWGQPAAQPAPVGGAPPAAAEAAPDFAELARRNPALAAALELPRETPAQMFRTLAATIDLGSPEAAALVLPELLQAPMDDSQRAALVRQFGPARFFELIRLDPPTAEGAAAGPLPGARDFAQQCLDAAAAEARDPERLATLIALLNSDDPAERQAARADLRATGEPAVAACFAALAAAGTEQQRGNLMAGLLELEPFLAGPLVAVLADARGMLRRDAAEIAGYITVSEATPWLAAVAVSPADAAVAAAANASLARLGMPTPTPGEAQQLIRERIANLEAMPAPSDLEPPGVWWSWNDGAQQLTSVELPADRIRLLRSARLARALQEAGGLASPADRRLAVIRQLEEAAAVSRPIGDETRKLLTEMTVAEVNQSLADAVAAEHFAAAVALATDLGLRRDPAALASGNGRPTPLAAALASPVRPLRFAALEAVMQINPTAGFAGSSAVAESLWYFAASAGEPVVIVASPVLTRASRWAGQLRGLRYQAFPAATGRAAIAAALDRSVAPRLVVVMLDGAIGQPLIGETVFQLRSSDLTFGVPILIAAGSAQLGDADRIANANPLVHAAPRPRTAEALATLIERTVGMTGGLAPAEQRTEQAAKALGWIAGLLQADAPYDELRRDAPLVAGAIYTPGLAEPSLAVLAALGTADSQSLLADYASAHNVPLESRRAAVAALRASVQRFGKQLTAAQVLEQYNRYNASETADADTQQVLGQILDLLEGK